MGDDQPDMAEDPLTLSLSKDDHREAPFMAELSKRTFVVVREQSRAMNCAAPENRSRGFQSAVQGTTMTNPIWHGAFAA